MKIKSKRPFGEKHHLRQEKAEKREEIRASQRHNAYLDRIRTLIADSTLKLADSQLKTKRALQRLAWYQRIEALRAEDPCEFFHEAQWHAAIFIQPVDDQEERWRVRDSEGKGLLALCVRQPGDQEAWPALLAPPSEEFTRLVELMGGPLPAPKYVVPDLEGVGNGGGDASQGP